MKTLYSRNVILWYLIFSFVLAFVVMIAAFIKRNENRKNYNTAEDYIEEENYENAIDLLDGLEGYKDSDEKIIRAKYDLAIEYYNNNDYENAKKMFLELDNYLESKIYLAIIEIKLTNQEKEMKYQSAFLYYEEREYKKAYDLYESIIDYRGSEEFWNDCKKHLKRESHNNIVAAGIRSSAAITNIGNVRIVGNISSVQNEISKWKNIISIDIYGTLIIGLKKDGTAEIAGNYDGNTIDDVEDWKGIIDIAAGEQFVVGLKEDGSVIAAGHSGDGQLEVGNWKKVIAVDAGSRFTVGLTENRELLFAGFDNGQSKEFEKDKNKWENVVNIAASGGEKNYRGGGHTVGLNADGTLVGIGDNDYGQCDFSDKEKWSDIVKVVAGDWYTVGLKSNGTVVMTGENSPGNAYIDEKILNQCTNIVDIAAGYGQTLCLTDNGKIIAFGFNDENKRDGAVKWNGLAYPEY